MIQISKYINPFTDFGFKHLFGEEPNKDLLMDFLNELLKDRQGKIVEMNYLKSEKLGSTDFERKAIFDIYCEDDRGEKFIVEIQKSKHNFFKDRTVYYSTFPIREQAKKNEWNFELKAVYLIAILDFVFDEDKNNESKYLYNVQLSDIETHKVFYDKLTFIYIEIPKFKKTIDELENRFEKWLFLIKNIDQLERIPEKFREKTFEKFFKVAEIANFTKNEFSQYEESLKYYRDYFSAIETAKEEGKSDAKSEIVIEMLKNNESDEKILRYTQISKEQLENIKYKLKDK